MMSSLHNMMSSLHINVSFLQVFHFSLLNYGFGESGCCYLYEIFHLCSACSARPPLSSHYGWYTLFFVLKNNDAILLHKISEDILLIQLLVHGAVVLSLPDTL